MRTPQLPLQLKPQAQDRLAALEEAYRACPALARRMPFEKALEEPAVKIGLEAIVRIRYQRRK